MYTNTCKFVCCLLQSLCTNSIYIHTYTYTVHAYQHTCIHTWREWVVLRHCFHIYIHTYIHTITTCISEHIHPCIVSVQICPRSVSHNSYMHTCMKQCVIGSYWDASLSACAPCAPGTFDQALGSKTACQDVSYSFVLCARVPACLACGCIRHVQPWSRVRVHPTRSTMVSRAGASDTFNHGLACGCIRHVQPWSVNKKNSLQSPAYAVYIIPFNPMFIHLYMDMYLCAHLPVWHCLMWDTHIYFHSMCIFDQ
jgi:hypothetical protein